MIYYKRILNLPWEAVEPFIGELTSRNAGVLTALLRDKEPISSIARRVDVSVERVRQVALHALAEIALLILEKDEERENERLRGLLRGFTEFWDCPDHEPEAFDAFMEDWPKRVREALGE